MENIKIGKDIDKSFYLTKDSDFARAKEIIGLMPNFQIGKVHEYEYADMYFETPEKFLTEIDASVRIRKTPEKQTLSIVVHSQGTRREFEMEMEYASSLASHDEYLLFLEDKIQDIYTHKMDIDVIRTLKNLRPFLQMTTKRTVHEIVSGTDFRAEVDFDRTFMHTKRNDDQVNIIKIKNKSFLSMQNEQQFERFVKEIQKRMVLIPMDEKKLDAGIRVFRREW